MSVLEMLTDLLVLHRALDGPAVDHQGIAAIPCSTDQVLDLGIVDEEQTYATAAELAVPLLVGMHAAGNTWNGRVKLKTHPVAWEEIS